MSKTVLLSAMVLFCLSITTVEAKNFNRTELTWYFSALRGFGDGVQKSLYDNRTYEISPYCLTKTMIANMVEFEDRMDNFDIIYLFQNLGVLFQISNSVDKYCDANRIALDLMDFITDKNVTDEDITTNMNKNLFVMTGTVNDLLAMFLGEDAHSDWTDLDEAFTMYNTLGLRAGKLARVIIGFTPHTPQSWNQILDPNNKDHDRRRR